MNPTQTAVSSMSTPDLVNAVIGLFLPPLIAVIQQPRWAKWFRSLVTAAICVAIALVRCWQLHEIDPRDILRTILIVLITTLSTYEGFWQKTVAPAIEKGTSAVGTAVSTLPAFLAALPGAVAAAKAQSQATPTSTASTDAPPPSAAGPEAAAPEDNPTP